MSVGILPSLVVVNSLYDEWQKPGVLWFIVSMITGGLWALIYTLMTLIPSPEITRLLANFFWPVVTTAAVSLFLLAYEFVFKEIASRRLVIFLFAPVVILFLLSWGNPANIVFGSNYYVDANGYLRFSMFGDPLRLLVVQIYGYSLAFLAAGMFVGDMIRSDGIHRQQASYLCVVFVILVFSSMIKVGELVPIYYDPTSTVYAFSGLLFAHSIQKHGLLQYGPVARESAFEEIEDIILVVDANDVIIDTNRAGRQQFGSKIYDRSIQDLRSEYATAEDDNPHETVQLDCGDEQRIFSVHSSVLNYGRGIQGKIIILSDITDVTERERELNLLKEIFSRVFRHNIRNDLTVITGYADLITEQQQDNERVAELTAGIVRKSNHLLKQSEKARSIETVIMDDNLVTGSIQDAVDDAISSCELTDNYTVQSTVEAIRVEFHPQFHLAVVELIENAVVHHAGPEQPEITLSTESTDTRVCLIVEDTSGGIPQAEIDVLEAQEETDLQHSSGIGLWLVRYIIKRSNGQLSATNTTEGTRIRIHLPKAND
ncbi:sensor histidine kinase [Halohasta litchfieldiae]|nr:histidine kinase N-terminal 7TM domain-containing protein [Halohasta litchfieldiae]